MESYIALVMPFLWIALRTGGVLVTAPVLGTRYVPWTIKVTVSLVTAFFLWNVVPRAPVPEGLPGLAVAAFGEVLFGIVIGFMGTVMLAAIEMAGHIADVEIGFGIANVVDPHYGQPAPLLGTLQYLLVLLVFLELDGHHLFLRALRRSFELVPAGGAFVPVQWAHAALGGAREMLWVALGLSAPVWVSMLVTDVSMGVISHGVPQMNVFVVGIPLKILVGLGILGVSVAFYGAFGQRIVLEMSRLVDLLLGVFAR
ncbi:MAG TPA: flagellar biosynthetic protein FliR [Firmicutes bacterium]|nr:flagellar biosynthetic protein FliR [Candidatus Fermentithermobacillaceae bacterium]